MGLNNLILYFNAIANKSNYKMGGCTQKGRFSSEQQIVINQPVQSQCFTPRLQNSNKQIILKPNHYLSCPGKQKNDRFLNRMSTKDYISGTEVLELQNREISGKNFLRVNQDLNLMETFSHYIQEQNNFAKNAEKCNQSQYYQQSVILPREQGGYGNPYKKAQEARKNPSLQSPNYPQTQNF